MRRIKGPDTVPEKRVRSLLHRLGFRFSLGRKDLPGRNIGFVEEIGNRLVHGWCNILSVNSN
ncbi:MAG: hypothetical protein JO062_29070 [Bryobacterales bacterium]|nr:hypothetical protein [Bryobacterales bacterium]